MIDSVQEYVIDKIEKYCIENGWYREYLIQKRGDLVLTSEGTGPKKWYFCTYVYKYKGRYSVVQMGESKLNRDPRTYHMTYETVDELLMHTWAKPEYIESVYDEELKAELLAQRI